MATLLRQRYQLGVLQFHPSEATLGNGQTERHLTPKETRILLALQRNAGRPRPGDLLYKEVWETDTLPKGWRRCLDSLIRRLRDKAAELHVGDFVINQPRLGYHLHDSPVVLADHATALMQSFMLETLSYEELLRATTVAGGLTPGALIVVASPDPLEAQPRYQHHFAQNLAEESARYLFLLEPRAVRAAARLIRTAIDTRTQDERLTSAMLSDALCQLRIVFTNAISAVPCYILDAESEDGAEWYLCRPQHQQAIRWARRSLARPMQLLQLIPPHPSATVEFGPGLEYATAILDDFTRALEAESRHSAWGQDNDLVRTAVLTRRKPPLSTALQQTPVQRESTPLEA